MYKTIDVARMVIWLTNEEHGDLITNLKLQKLMYYLQGFWLAAFDTPLFNARVEAWGYGPVVPIVYEAFCRYGGNQINVKKEGKELHFKTEEEEDFFYNVFNTFNQYSASMLVRMTHAEPPWKSAGGIGQGHVIPRDVMRRYFKTRLED